MNAFDLLILCLATWRIAHMFTKELGPWHIFERLRTRYPLGGLLECPYCLSVWVAPLVLLMLVSEQLLALYIVLVFAISGGALMLGAYSTANLR